MKITESSVQLLTITDVPGLDPIRVVCENIEPGRGRIIIQCYMRAWCGYWGAMGKHTVESFVASSGSDYVYDNIVCADPTRENEAYLTRIIKAVKEALSDRAVAPAPSDETQAMTESDHWDYVRWQQELVRLADEYYATGSTSPARERARATLVYHALDCATGWRARSAVARLPVALKREPDAWMVWWGLCDMRPHWPPFKTKAEAEAHAAMIKSNTEVRPLYTGDAQ